jgi:hypothetical protein
VFWHCMCAANVLLKSALGSKVSVRVRRVMKADGVDWASKRKQPKALKLATR